METNKDQPISVIGNGTKWAGLTKREHFAAMAMQGISTNLDSNSSIEQDCKLAVMYADALIEELNKD